MMCTTRLILGFAALLALTANVSFAQAVQTIDHAEIAEYNCPQQWAKLAAADPTYWATLDPLVIDPDLSVDATNAANKYVAAILSLAEYVTYFLGYSMPENQTQAYLDMAEARFDLAECLMPTQPERDLIVDMALSITSRPEPEIRAILFEAFDNYDCMRMGPASEHLFELSPTSPTFAADLENTLLTTMRACD